MRPLVLYIAKDHPNGTQVLALFDDSGVNLIDVTTKPGSFGGGFNAFDRYGDLKPGYYLQVGERDFEHNGIPYIVIAVGNGLFQLHVTVLKYHPPLNRKDAVREQNWEEVGSFEGQTQAWLNGDSFELPFGSAGLSTEFTLVKGRFVETDDLTH